MGLTIKKKISLAEVLGEGHDDSYMIVRPVPYNEYNKLNDDLASSDKTASEFAYDLTKERFVEGKIVQDGESQELTVENLGVLPGEVFLEVFEYLTGKISPKG